MNVLFVCTGNTCRSPMAQVLFESKTKDYSDTVRADSCGLAAFDGAPASDGARYAVSTLGLSLENHRAKRITPAILSLSDVVLCMNSAAAKSLEPFAPGKVFVLGRGISDPYGLGADEYVECMNEISQALDDLLGSRFFIRLSKAKPVDAGDIASIEKKIFNPPWTAENVRSALESDCAVAFKAEYLGQTSGYILGRVMADEAEIDRVATETKLRRRGVAGMLLESFKSSCRERGAKKIFLEVRQSNTAARALYEKYGFTAVSVRKYYYSNPAEDAVAMLAELDNDGAQM